MKSAPLTGTIKGKPFASKSALVTKNANDPVARDVAIYATDANCAAPPAPVAGDDEILITIQNWTPGMSYELDFGHLVDLVDFTADSANNDEVVTGRVEVSSDGKTLGLRANDSVSNVEGQISLTICDP